MLSLIASAFLTSLNLGFTPLSFANPSHRDFDSLGMAGVEGGKPACHECSLNQPGARTYLLMLGDAEDPKDESFQEDFRHVLSTGFRSAAFPPVTQKTSYSIPIGFEGTSHFDADPMTVYVPKSESVQDATSSGDREFKQNLQDYLNEIFGEMHPFDTFVLYISSHGKDIAGIYNFKMAYDLDSNGAGSEERTRRIVSIPLRELDFSKCPACSVVILADTCYSNTMVTNLSDLLKRRTGNVVLIGSAAEVAQDWRDERPQVLSTENGAVSIPKGGVFTCQFLNALGNQDPSGDLYSVTSGAAKQASEIANQWSLKVTSKPQVGSIWTRAIPTSEACSPTETLPSSNPQR